MIVSIAKMQTAELSGSSGLINQISTVYRLEN